MFSWIIGTSLQSRALIIGIAVALVVLGTLQLNKMPIDVFPEFAAPVVRVQTEALGLSAEEVEALITLNLEEILSGVPWLESVRSESVIGLSSIVLTFERGTDLMRARQMVQERLTLAYALPNVSSTPALLQPLSATGRFMMIGISSDEVEETDLSLLARWTIKPKLVGVPGVASVAIWGQRLREMQVHVDPERLRDARLMQSDVIQAVGDSLWITPLTFLRGSAPGTGGFLDNQNQRLGVHHKMPIVTPEDMAKVALTPQHLLMTGKKMTLGEVAEVTYSHPPLIGDAFVNDGSGLLLVIEKFPSANTLEVTRGVEQAIAELSVGLPGVEINADVFRLATYIEASISNLANAIIIGAILVVLVIGAFLFNWRSALISIVSIPVSLLAAVIVLSLTDATLNTMILAGLVVALGVVIDDAIVDVEKIMGRLRQGRESGPSIARIIYETTLETRSATIYAALIVLMAVMPIFFLGGVSGAFFKPLAVSYVLAILASLIVGMTLTPALSLVLFGKSSPGTIGESPITGSLRNGYEAVLHGVMRTPRAMIMAGGAVLVAGIVVWPLLGQSLLPAFKEREVLVNWTTPPGTSHKETYRITTRVSRELQSLPGVRNVSAHIGRAITGDQVVGINSSQIWVGIEDDADYDEMVHAVRNTVDGYPGVDRSVHAYLRDTIGKVLTGESTPIVVRIFGQSRDILRDKAEEVRQALSGIDGLVDLRTVGDVEEPQVRVKVDLDAASEASVKPGEVRRSAATVFSGLNAGFLFEEQKIFDVVVWSPPEVRQSLSDVQDVLVEKTDRHHVRLDEVADVGIVSVPTVIKHIGVAPYIDVVANIAGRDLGSVNQDVENRLQTVEFPLEYYPELLGEFVERQEAQKRIMGVAIAALVGIFLLLQACFRSWRLALIAFLALPASAAGGVLAVLISGGVVTLGSIVGFFAVLGIAARNGILLITHYQHLEGQEGVPFDVDLVIRGARERMTPILASSAAIIAALLPIAFFGLIPGLEIVQPTAIVIIGGLVASTLVTLFVLPALYLVVGSRADRQVDLGLSVA
jgi:CzcA family heavy metal efflux pump